VWHIAGIWIPEKPIPGKRDELRADERLRAEYSNLKRGLQARFAENRKGYTEARNEFVYSVVNARGPDRQGSRP
jgi:GrpB protein